MMSQPVKLPVTFLLPYGQGLTAEMSQPSRKPSERAYRRSLTDLMRSSLCLLVVILAPVDRISDLYVSYGQIMNS
jgi:hypothetical protein